MFTLALLLFSVAFIVIATTRFNLHPFLALLLAAFLFGAGSGLPLGDLVAAVNNGFGATVGAIGIIIIAGIIIGTFLEKSGGAYALADRIIRWTGPKRTHSAMAFIGYIVAIPVFSDSGFVILSSLNRAITKKAGLSLAGTAIALGLGLSSTHALVPPTPGPIAAAGILEADLGTVILIGLFTSLFAATITTWYAKKMGSRTYIDPAPDLDETQLEQKIAQAPSALKSFLPIIVPIVLIVLRSIAEYPTQPFGADELKTTLSFIGNPVIALFIGIGLAFLLPKKLDRQMLGTTGWVGEALKNAAIIILITGAGGAFGKVIQASNINTLFIENISGGSIGIWFPFLIAAAIKTAQGSSTVAIITTASIIAPMLPALGLDAPTARAVVVVAIGAGSLVVSHVNDSFFWVVTQMSDMDIRQGYRLHTVGTAILGFSAILFLTALSYLI